MLDETDLTDRFVDLALRGEIAGPDEFFAAFPDLGEDEKRRIRELAPLLLFGAPTGVGESTARRGMDGSTTSTELESEELGFGDFQIIRVLGAGGAGEVFLARQRSIDRNVALKLLHSGHVGSPEAVRRFEREAHAIGKLQHPHIVSVYGTGVFSGRPYLVMEFVPGQGLDEILERERAQGGGLDPRQILSWGAQIAQALDCAHRAGVIHRDVKPANIRIRPDGTATLLDFGLAREERIETLTVTGAFRGSPVYASPEQIESNGTALDGRTDLYSLGVTLYECATGRTPFSGATTEQVFYEVLSRDPVAPRQLNRALSADLETVILKGLEKEPMRRYSSAGEFAAELTAILEGRPIRARRVGAVTRAYKWSRRHPGAAVAMGLFCMIVTVGPTLYAIHERTANREIAARELETEQQRKAAVAALDDVRRAETQLKRRLDEIRRLSDIKRVREVLAEVEFLWPLVPSRVEDFDVWLGVAKDLVSRRVLHQATLSRLETEADPHSEPGSPNFADPGDAWQHQISAELLESLTELTESIREVERRRDFAARIEARSNTGESVCGSWERASREIADSCQYDGLQIVPQLGLVPLGPDPDSGLWEFGHLPSGDLCRRDAETGKLELNRRSGLVMVLLPGGVFSMGARVPTEKDPAGAANLDPLARSEEGPVHEVTLRPFFLSKYEMTQGQWIRLAGVNPSAYPASGEHRRTLLNPVEQTSWEDCRQMVHRLDLRLPTEAQWEYAARGGTGTPWWTGAVKTDLQGAANLLDSYCRAHGGPRSFHYEMWLDDGSTVHAPIGSYVPNPFGLHNLVGNVAEWCLDGKVPYDAAARSGDGLRSGGESPAKIYRGGAFSDSAAIARVSARFFSLSDVRLLAVGLRPSRPLLDRPSGEVAGH